MKDIIQLLPAPKIEGCYLAELKVRIVNRIKEVGLDKPQYKTEVKCILYVAIMIESALNKSHKLNKRELLLDIFKEIYGLSQDDELMIKNSVELLHLSKKIKPKSWYKLYCTSLLEAFRL